ncbi:MAG: glycosyltransferase [Synergistaceae bacterium]|jgi:glycosyltransferase involved in cell wall biosynthesis|nr:glycosyltransferase [Synergistaceae bacterium]
MTPLLAIVIPTRNRAGAIQKYALSSLERSDFRDFACVVQDASDDDLTREAVEERPWNFEVSYVRATRTGSSSQRNDAVRRVLTELPGVRYIVFMDDDSELSSDALSGVLASFRESGASIVNIRTKPVAPPSFRSKMTQGLKRVLGTNRHGATAFLYNYGGNDEATGEVEWASGCGMGVDVSVFREWHIFFPEEFERFGGYALGEDFAFSFFVSQRKRGRIVNSAYGHLLHYAAGSARLDVRNMAASKWYNFHLLFDAIYESGKNAGGPGRRWLRAKFGLFMCAAAVKLLLRARSLDVASVLRGIFAARAALKDYRRNHDIRTLMSEK